MYNDDFDWFDIEENDFMEECEYGANLEAEEYKKEGGKNE